MEAEASATDGEEGFFDGQTGIMMAVVAPVALLSLLLCVCIGCRRKRQRETASASTAARNSYKSDGEFLCFCCRVCAILHCVLCMCEAVDLKD